MDSLSLHQAATVVDTHDDLLMLVDRRPLAEQGAYFRNHWLPQLRSGGVDVQVLPVFIDDDFRHEGALRQTLKMIEAAWRIEAANHDQVSICLTGADIAAANADGKIALILAMEGCEAVGSDVDLFSVLHRVGIRIASLTHFGRNMLADGSGEDAAGSRLTRAGVEAVRLMQELGIIVDVSHLGLGGVEHVLEISTRPVLATHSSAYELRGHHRNLTDERLKGIADSGGVINVNFFAGFLADDPAARTLERVGDHLEHVAEIAGLGAVGLGPDFVKEVFDELFPLATEIIVEGINGKECVPGLEGPSGLPLITGELVRRGWSEADITGVLGGNDVRLFAGELGLPG